MHLQDLPNASDDATFFGGHGSRPEDWGAHIPAERFSHLALGVTNLDRSEEWYRDVIGLDVVGRNLTAEPLPHSVLQMNTGQLMILVQGREIHIPGRSGVHHGFMLTPNQYRRAHDRLKELGYDIGDERQQYRAHGEYSIDIEDPDGHRYQLQTYGPEANLPMPGAGIVDCGTPDTYRVGDVRAFKDGNFFLVRHHEGFLALSRWCRHMNGTVIYQKAHWHFVCPFHDATYDRRGVDAPFMGNRAQGPLHLHPITFGPEGHIRVDTDTIIPRDGYDASQAAQPPAAELAAAR